MYLFRYHVSWECAPEFIKNGWGHISSCHDSYDGNWTKSIRPREGYGLEAACFSQGCFNFKQLNSISAKLNLLILAAKKSEVAGRQILYEIASTIVSALFTVWSCKKY